MSPTSALQPYVNLVWHHAYGNAQDSAAVTFQTTGVPFSIKGASINPDPDPDSDPDPGWVEAGLSMMGAIGATLTAAYIGQISTDWQDHKAKVELSWAF